jgi:hypothetical protein
MGSKDQALDDKKRKLAELKLAKERLEAELAAFDDELAEEEAKLSKSERATAEKRQQVGSLSTESESSIALKSRETKTPAPKSSAPAKNQQRRKASAAGVAATSPASNGSKKATGKDRKKAAPIVAAAATVATSTLATSTLATSTLAANAAVAEETPLAESQPTQAPQITSQAPAKTQEPVQRPVDRQTAPAAPMAQPAQAAAAAATATATTIAQQNAEASSQEDDEEDEYEDEPAPSIFAIRSAPPWLVSTVLHVIGLIILGLYTLASLPEEEKRIILASTIEEQEEFEEMEEVSLEVEEVEFENITSESITEMDPGATAFSDVTATVEASSEGMEKVNLAKTTIGEIGNMFGTDGQGFADIGEGLAGAGTFFGKKAQGNKFVFVVDNSNSMNRGRFVTALDEMMKSISRMTEKQQFYIIFFSDTAYPMFHPNPAPGLVPATERNKERVAAWLYTVERCLKTKGELAMQRALELRPDVIYILGDGAFTDKTGPKLTAPHNRRTTIHTFGMEVSEKGLVELTGIAKANRGNFTPVKPTAASAKEGSNIKSNRFRGPIWGIDLPAGAKKKKKKK